MKFCCGQLKYLSDVIDCGEFSVILKEDNSRLSKNWTMASLLLTLASTETSHIFSYYIWTANVWRGTLFWGPQMFLGKGGKCAFKHSVKDLTDPSSILFSKADTSQGIRPSPVSCEGLYCTQWASAQKLWLKSNWVSPLSESGGMEHWKGDS